MKKQEAFCCYKFVMSIVFNEGNQSIFLMKSYLCVGSKIRADLGGEMPKKCGEKGKKKSITSNAGN